MLPEALPRAAGVLGGGVIGGGWAARFILNGVDVRLYDPAPNVAESVQKMLANARRAYRRLTDVPLPAEGALTIVDSVADAVHGVDLVQESVPECLELKRKLLATASRAAGPGVLICSSTAGFRPSLLQAEMDHAECLLVAHPFQPVYMLPLVELCGGQRTAPEMLERAAAAFRALGMRPLALRKEVDSYISNRLDEVVSRESVRLLHDDLATPQEIDDAVRHSLGLRLATMGAWYPTDGGTRTRQEIEQCAFERPSSTRTGKFGTSPNFLDKAAEKAASLAKAPPLEVPLEQKRDDLLVAVLQGLRSQDCGPGRTLARWEQGLRDRSPRAQPAEGSGPLRMPTLAIPSGWIDGNGHVAESRYLQLCSDATGALARYIGIDGEYRSRNGAYYTVETHLFHLGELRAGDRIQTSTQVLGADDKRLHLFHVITREGTERPAATGEQMLIHVDAATRRSGPVKGNVRKRLLELARVHALLPRPERASARIQLPPRAPVAE
ncbi:carnitine 3-dehydrogenase [Bradyrhizobium yuanmingense]|uniref:3-hydroxyacyl-CoA dehydrogenase NAD-binding domain-containing protein n=1 Tax=Bradyrhizobium yuanmingense TaxID=108015 RepID=UPI003518DE22